MKQKINLKLIDKGIAYSYGNTIEINRELLKHKEVLKDVIDHEVKHINTKGFFKNVLVDVKDIFDFKKQKRLNVLSNKPVGNH